VIRVKVSQGLIVPGLGVVVFVLAHLLQNVWSVFHVDEVTHALRGLNRTALLAAVFALGLGEGTVVLGLYLPGTAVLILLLLGLQPGWGEALPLLACLMAGTMAGYVASFLAGRLMHRRLPSLVGEARFAQVRSLLERYGRLAVIPAALHPNQLALAFAVLGYFRPARPATYFALAAIAQGLWWMVYGLGAGVVAGQDLVTRGNFQLYVAALFFVWFLYELLGRPKSERMTIP